MKVRFRCWWFGCSEHPLDPAPVEEITCQWCGELLSYEDMIGVTGVSYIVRSIVAGWYRRVVPSRCIDCGKRYKCHDKCAPF